MKGAILTACAFFLLIGGKTCAQPQVTATVLRQYSSNPLRYAGGAGDWITVYSGQVSWGIRGSTVGFQGTWQRPDILQNLRVSQSRLDIDIKTGKMRWGAFVSHLRYADDFSQFSSSQAGTYLRMTFPKGESRYSVEAGFSYRKYSSFPLLNRISGSIELLFYRGVANGIIILGGVGWFSELFMNPMQMSVPGAGKSEGEFWTGGGRMHRLSGWFRIARSLTPRIGLAVQADFQRIVGQWACLICSPDGTLSAFPFLLDDLSGFHSLGMFVLLTHLLPGSAVLRTGAAIAYRDYPFEGRYTVEGIHKASVRRRDFRTMFWLSLRKPLRLHFLGRFPLEVYWQCTGEQNQSSSDWFNYRNISWSVGFEWSR